jgi:hypothetical protein
LGVVEDCRESVERFTAVACAYSNKELRAQRSRQFDRMACQRAFACAGIAANHERNGGLWVEIAARSQHKPIDDRCLLCAADDAGRRKIGCPHEWSGFDVSGRQAVDCTDDEVIGLGGRSWSAVAVEVDVDAIEIVNLGQPSIRAQALAAGQVDATTMSIGVWSSLPDRTGLAILVDQDAYYEAAPVVNKVNIVTAETLETRGDEVRAVIRALVRLSRDVAENPTLWVDAMQAALPHMERATLEALAEAFEDSWSVNGGLSAPELQFTQDWLYESEDFQNARVVSLSEWVDFGPVDAVLSDLGTVPGMDEPAR